MTDEKHPISNGQPTRDELCWRQHRDGWVCLREEGHGDSPVQVGDTLLDIADLTEIQTFERELRIRIGVDVLNMPFGTTRTRRRIANRILGVDT